MFLKIGCYDNVNEDQKSKLQISTYGNFNFVIEWPIWVSIKIDLTVKLAVDGQNFTYCVQFQENVQKPLK